jgi:sialate O-acetylesterase
MQVRRIGFVFSLLFLWLALFTTPAAAVLKLPSLFSNHVILQRDREVPVWGWADPDAQVHVVIDGKTVETKAGQDGKWQVQIAPHEAGGPYTLVVEAGSDRAQVDDVYFGEVWVASGQSNMQWSVSQSANAEEEISAAQFPEIRMFSVPREPAAKPQNDTTGKWEVAAPESIAEFSAVGYYFARKLHQELGVPVGILHTSWGGTMAEAWTSREALEGKDEFAPILDRVEEQDAHQNRAAYLYNGMVAPLIPYAVRGAIWYQGESNVGRAEQYASLFPTLIADWRSRWGQGDFPFYFVQLAPFRYGNTDPELLAELWDAQLKTLRSVPNTGMVVTTDIATTNDIHPPNKQDVGQRLALWALANVYGKEEVVYSGPIYKSHDVEGNQVRIDFEHAGEGLMARAYGELSQFTIAGEDKKFVPAQAEIRGSSVVVSSEQVQNPVAVRFAWHDTAEPNLVNASGLPASPFRTDDWELKTHGKW